MSNFPRMVQDYVEHRFTMLDRRRRRRFERIDSRAHMEAHVRRCRKKIRRLVVREYLILLLAGIGSGFVAAIVATLPSILSAHTGTSFISIVGWLGVLVANGWIWILIITRTSLEGKAIYSALRNE